MSGASVEGLRNGRSAAGLKRGIVRKARRPPLRRVTASASSSQVGDPSGCLGRRPDRVGQRDGRRAVTASSSSAEVAGRDEEGEVTATSVKPAA